MIPHTVVVVIEPPGTSVLDLSNRRIILKTANDRIENGIVIGIQGIEEPNSRYCQNRCQDLNV